jgi:hypothetical protein
MAGNHGEWNENRRNMLVIDIELDVMKVYNTCQ